MKELPIFFIGKGEVRGFLFEQIYNFNNAYLYKITTQELNNYYEVFIRK